jgi:hypothetical protein
MALTAFEIDILKHFSESFMHLSQEMKICIANFWIKVVKSAETHVHLDHDFNFETCSPRLSAHYKAHNLALLRLECREDEGINNSK